MLFGLLHIQDNQYLLRGLIQLDFLQNERWEMLLLTRHLQQIFLVNIRQSSVNCQVINVIVAIFFVKALKASCHSGITTSVIFSYSLWPSSCKLSLVILNVFSLLWSHFQNTIVPILQSCLADIP